MPTGIVPVGKVTVDLNTAHNQTEFLLDFPANAVAVPGGDIAGVYIQLGSDAAPALTALELEKIYLLDNYIDRIYVTNSASTNPYSPSELDIYYYDFNRVRIDLNTNYDNMMKAFMNSGLSEGIVAGAITPTWYKLLTIDGTVTGETEYVHPFQQYVSIYPLINFVQILDKSDATWTISFKTLTLTPPAPIVQAYGDPISSLYFNSGDVIQISSAGIKINVTAAGTSNIVLLVGGHYGSLFEMLP